MVNNKGDRGVQIARLLWPELEVEPSGTLPNRYGIDGYLNGKDGKTVQIKYDSRITESHNIYHEYYEKSAGHPEQQWRRSPGAVDSYIFITETDTEICGYLIRIDVLAKAELGKALRVISPNNGDATSIGIVTPLASLKGKIRRQSKTTDAGY